MDVINVFITSDSFQFRAMEKGGGASCEKKKNGDISTFSASLVPIVAI